MGVRAAVPAAFADFPWPLTTSAGVADGRGYPLGLAGDAIPLEARILAVADAYEAMTADRPYRSALSHDAAREELRASAGTQFDPHVVDAFLAALAPRRRRRADVPSHVV